MKITAGVVLDVLRYWMKNGKTMTALITGMVIVALGQAGVTDMSPDNVELIVAAVSAAGLGFVGIWHKIVKLIGDKDGGDGNE